MTNRKELYGETFINHDDSSEIVDPIKLSYYKVMHFENNLEEENVTYSIEVVKEQNDEDIAMTETKEVANRMAKEEQVNELLEMLKMYKVTPISLQDVLNDLEKAQ